MKKLMLFCIAIAMVALVAAPANAEVQNVKVGGDITIRGIFQGTYDLANNDDNTTVGLRGTGNDGVSDENVTSFMATLGLNVDADLTDNVSATIRLVGERDWSSSYETLCLRGIANTDDADQDLHVRGSAPIFDGVQIDLAYITLKELLYSPLTLIIGRQDLWYGDGFIIGANLRPRAIMAPEFTDFRSFDAIRAILDYDPWTVDMFYSRVDEGNWVRAHMAVAAASFENALVDDSDNIEVWGINVGYVFDQYNAEAEVYYFGQTLPDRPFGALGHIVGSPATKDNAVHIFGARGSFEPIDNMDIRAEAAGEIGRVNVSINATPREIADVVDVRAVACDLSGAYTWVDYAWLPRLGLGYVFMSGESQPRNDEWNGWINPYRGKFYSAIHEWQGIFYTTDDLNTTAADPNANNNAWTNQHTVIIDASIQPLDDILLEGRYLHFMAQHAYGLATGGLADRSKQIGDEVNLRLTYDYTEDVTFGLLTAWFFPGEYFLARDGDHYGHDIASEIVGSVALTF